MANIWQRSRSVLSVGRGAWVFVSVSAFLWAAGILGPPCALAQARQADTPPPHVVFLLDSSGSMADGDRLAHTRLAAKLGLVVLGNARVTLIRFADETVVSPAFDLPRQLAEAERWIDEIAPGGGTKYLAGLAAIPAGDLQVVWLSDGMSSDPAEEVYRYVREHIHATLHTIAMQTLPEAEQILATMAAATGGGFYRVRESSEVVEAFLRILGQTRRFRRHESNERSLPLPKVCGELLAVGFDVAPEFSPAADVERYDAELPGGRVHVSRTVLTAGQDVEVRGSAAAGGAGGRVIVLRFDLPLAAMTLNRLDSGNGQVVLQAETGFCDALGNPLPAAAVSELSSRFEVLDAQGNMLSSADATQLAGSATMQAVLPLPAQANGPLVVRNTTAAGAAGAVFTAEETLAVEVAALPVIPQLAVRTELEAVSVAAGEPLGCTVAIRAADPSTEAFQQFREALAAQPPTVAVRTPSGRRIDSRSQPQAFRLRPMPRPDAVAYEVQCLEADESGEYEVTVQEGQVGGVVYPSAADRAQRLADDCLQLLVVSHRTGGNVVLFDSLQRGARHALVGDRLSCELVRGGLDPRVFAGLANGLRARFLRADGAVQTVPLRLAAGRYTTDSVPFDHPGSLTVEVDLAAPGLRWRITSEVKIEQVLLDLKVGDGLLTRGPSTLPLNALLPFEVFVVGSIGSRPASSADLVETLSRRQARLGWKLTDSAGQVVRSDQHTAGKAPWVSRVHFQRTGRQVVDLELVGDGSQVLARVSRTYDVVPGVVAVGFARRAGDGSLQPLEAGSSLARCLPRFLVLPASAVVTAAPAASHLSGAYFLAGFSVNGQEATFVPEQGCFVYPLPPDATGVLECLARLQPQEFGAAAADASPEVQSLESIPARVPISVRWGRVSGLAVGLVGAASLGFLHWRRQRYATLAAHRIRVFLWTGEGEESASLVPQKKRPLWPAAQLSVGQVAGTPDRLLLAQTGRLPRNASEIARVSQDHNGAVVLQAVADLAALSQGTTYALSLGDNYVHLSDTATLSVDFPPAADEGALIPAVADSAVLHNALP